MTFQPNNSNAVFLPTTIQYPKEPDELISRLNKAYEDTATRLNVKQIGIFDLVEFLTGEQWFTSGDPQTKRQTFRIAVDFGALPNNTTKSVAHNIVGIDPGTNSTFSFTHIYGTGTNPTTGSFKAVPIPYVNVGTPGDGIEIWVDKTNVNIKTTTANWIAFSANVVLEYLKN